MTDPLSEPGLELIVELDEVRRSGYDRELPGPLDQHFAALARVYADSDGSGRAAIRDLISNDMALPLLGFSDRFAVLAARSGDSEVLFTALLAHVTEDFRYDPRENIFRLAVVYHVARTLGVDPDALFARAAALGSARAARHLEEFCSRPETLKSLKTMRIEEVATPDGVDFRYR